MASTARRHLRAAVELSGNQTGRGPSAVAGPYPHASGFDGNDRTVGQVRTMRAECGDEAWPLLACSEADEADDASVGLSSHYDEFAEVLVERDQHPTLSGGAGEDLLVARIRIPLAGMEDVVPGRAKRVDRPGPDAGVEQNLHEP